MNNIRQRAEEYKHQADRSAVAHYMMSEILNRRHTVLGTVTIACATVVGTTIFATLQNSPTTHWRISAGIISMLAAVLASLQTFLRLAEKASAHKKAGLNYSDIRRSLEIYLLEYADEQSKEKEPAIQELKSIKEDLRKLAENSPVVPEMMWDRVDRKRLSQQNDEEGFGAAGAPGYRNPEISRMQ